jgi:hypothetical protein
MNKLSFVRLAAAFLLPHTAREDGRWDLDRALHYANEIWNRTGGPEVEAQPREVGSWYAGLPADQRAGFDRLWQAYGHKHGKERAAMRWAQLNPDRELAEAVIAAAQADRLKDRPKDQARKWLEGWLAERRWTDFEAAAVPAQDRQADERRRALADLLAIETLYQTSRNPDLLPKVAAMRQALKLPEYQPPKARNRDRPQGLATLRDFI